MSGGFGTGNRIGTNVAADFSRRILNGTNNEIDTRLQRLASALRINNAGDDAAGFSVAQRLETQTRGFDQAARNVQDAASVNQIAEGGISTVADNLQRVRELAVQAANGTLTDADRALLQQEVSEIKAEIDRFAPTVTFNGQPLLDGTFAEGATDFQVQAGPNKDETISVNFDEVSTAALNVDTVDISTQAGAESALDSIDSALNTLAGSTAKIGANSNRLTRVSDFIGISRENSLAAQSRIQDADFAAEIVGLTLAQVRQQAGTASLVQANLSPQSVLSLLR